jgi:MEDS: MEthanogen/methylotroph, DcmR Sensory domain
MKDASLAGTTLDPYYHVCALVGSRDDEYRVLAPFYRETLDWGEKLLHVVDDRLRTDHDRRLEQHGVPACRCQQSGQLQVFGWSETYLRDGEFDQHKMLDAVQGVIDGARAEGYPRTRIMGNMNWALDGPPGSEQLIEYEVRVNEVLAREKQPAVCVYDLNRLTGTMMMDLLRAHPLTLVNGVVQHNPFFTPPERMLTELSERRSRAGSPAMA